MQELGQHSPQLGSLGESSPLHSSLRSFSYFLISAPHTPRPPPRTPLEAYRKETPAYLFLEGLGARLHFRHHHHPQACLYAQRSNPTGCVRSLRCSTHHLRFGRLQLEARRCQPLWQALCSRLLKKRDKVKETIKAIQVVLNAMFFHPTTHHPFPFSPLFW